METLVTTLAIAVFILTSMGAVVYTCLRWPVLTMLCLLLLVVFLATATSSAATFEVAAIIESEDDRASMEDAMRDAAAIYADQLGITLTVTYVDVNTVATHTNAEFLLDALKEYRVERGAHLATDASILLTRRDITVGGKGYAGIAMTGPACSAAAAAIVELRNDGYDGLLIAHELAHTMGVMHDKESGWLMSETLTRALPSTFSSGSIDTIAAADTSCFDDATTETALASEGGGGAMDSPLFLALLALLVAWVEVRRIKRYGMKWTP